MKHGV